MIKLAGTYFYGHDASDYAKENGYLDFYTLSKAFDNVLNNDLRANLENKGFYFELVSGYIDFTEEINALEDEIGALEEQVEQLEETGNNASELETELEEKRLELEELEEKNGDYPETDIFQEFIVPEWAVNEILKDINQIVFYCEELDLYIWGVTHYGTAWTHVLTDIKLNCND